MKWKVAYLTEVGRHRNGKPIWQACKPVPVVAGRSVDSARIKFDQVFHACFGNTIAYQITTILRQGVGR